MKISNEILWRLLSLKVNSTFYIDLYFLVCIFTYCFGWPKKIGAALVTAIKQSKTRTFMTWNRQNQTKFSKKKIFYFSNFHSNLLEKKMQRAPELFPISISFHLLIISLLSSLTIQLEIHVIRPRRYRDKNGLCLGKIVINTKFKLKKYIKKYFSHFYCQKNILFDDSILFMQINIIIFFLHFWTLTKSQCF